jgi:hypothetical protein
MDGILINNALWVPFRIRCEEYMRIGVKLSGIRRRQVHVRYSRADGERDDVTIKGF